MAKVLIVDDAPMIRALLETALTQVGHEVAVAGNGREALERFEQVQPQVCIIDLRLPDFDGVTVIRKIRHLDPSACVIVLTGAGDSTLADQARALGVSDFLVKGQGLDEILATVNRRIEGLAQALLTLPRESEEPASPVARILVVDDEAMVRELLQQWLSKQGYRVQTAEDGPTALRLIEAFAPHLILLDLHLPGMSGLQLLRRLGNRTRKIGVIVVTGRAEPAVIKEAMDLGSFSCVSKPLNLDALSVQIRGKLALLEANRQSWWSRWLPGRGEPPAQSLIPRCQEESQEEPPDEPSNLIPFPGPKKS